MAEGIAFRVRPYGGWFIRLRNHIPERGGGISGGDASGQAAVIRGEGVFDAMNEEFFQRFYKGASPLHIHKAGGNSALYAGMDLRGAHSEVSGKGCIRPLAFAQRDNFQENNYVLWFENHGRILFAIRE
ncbi:MAG: hypothetical protein A2X95_08715 [Syntrophobacterales bacterium GWF2_56_9]|nr:MAG: hypothetical protein A2X95_08715 [Syntrophobacterales bacterium GWF2_56_9]